MLQPPSLNSDQEILQKISNKDEAAFLQLYNRYHLPIYNYIVRLIHEENTAEELLQDVFLAVWQGARTFRSQSSVKTWIFRIAYFQSITWLRKEKRFDQIDEPGDYFAIEITPEDIYLQKIENAHVIAALEKLSPNHRSVIELTFVHGFSYNEIAEIMKCPVGTVKSRMSYGLKYLQAELSRTNYSKNNRKY